MRSGNRDAHPENGPRSRSDRVLGAPDRERSPDTIGTSRLPEGTPRPMDLNRLMRPLLPIAVVALAAAGCSASTDADLTAPAGGHPQAAEEDSPFAGVTDPVALDIQAPEGFTADDALVREVPMSDAVNTYSFRLDGGADTAVIQVSTYVLPDPVDDSDYRGAVSYIRDYDAQVGYEYTLENDRGTIAHGRAGVGMLTGFPWAAPRSCSRTTTSSRRPTPSR
nr:hypothetical protein GCM10025732_12770 [Glycomyces mayteni]